MEIDIVKGHVFLVDKPLEWTSFDVVNKLRYAVIRNLRAHQPELFVERKYKPKVGHAGTLDPLATGLLIVCAGKETKNIDTYTGMEKEYTGSFYIGATTPSFDKETEENARFEISHITPELLKETAKKLTGPMNQTPPAYSAIWKDGVRAYQAARAGKSITLAERPVIISEFELTDIALPLVHFRIVCSKGTYIRSIAADFGTALGAGAYLNSLCRTRIGNFDLKNAMSVEQVLQLLAV